MRKLIGHREVTLAIGVVVAIVIALTLWVAGPVQQLTGFSGVTGMKLPAPPEAVQSSAAQIIDFLFQAP